MRKFITTPTALMFLSGYFFPLVVLFPVCPHCTFKQAFALFFTDGISLHQFNQGIFHTMAITPMASSESKEQGISGMTTVAPP